MLDNAAADPRASRLRLADGCAAALGILWLAVFPLASDFTYAHITRAKWIAMLIGTGLSLPLTAAALLLEGKRPRRLPPAWLLLLGALLWIGLSACFGSLAGLRDRDGVLLSWLGSANRYEALATQLCYFAIFTCAALLPWRERSLRWTAVGTAAGVVCFCGVAALQYAGLNPLGLFPARRSIFTNYEFQSTIGNIDMCTVYLSVVLPFLGLRYALHGGRSGGLLLAAAGCGTLLQLLMDVQAGFIYLLLWGALTLCLLTARPVPQARPGWRGRTLCLLAVLLLACCLRRTLLLPWLRPEMKAQAVAFTLDVGQLGLCCLAGAAGCALLALKLRKKDSGGLRMRTVALAFVAAGLLALAGIRLAPIPERMGGLWELHELLCGRPQDQFGSWRLGAWRASLLYSRESPLFGTGPGSFTAGMDDFLVHSGIVLGEHYDNPHNVLVNLLVTSGYPAMLLYGAGMAAAVWQGGRNRRHELSASLLCYLAQAMFTFSICLVSPIAWAACGIAVSAEDRDVGTDEAETEESPAE